MGCINNKKKFLGIRFEGPHNFIIKDIGVHMAGISGEFKILKECSACGCAEVEWQVSFNRLLHMGYSSEYLIDQRYHEIDQW